MLDLQNRITRDVYTTKNNWYLNGSKKPSYEFLDKPWKWREIDKTITSITKELYYDGGAMSIDPKGWKHFSNVPGWGDSRNYLAAILNELHDDPYTSSMMWGNRHFSHARRKYWDNFVEDLFDRGKLTKYFDDAFRKHKIYRS